MSAHSCPQAAGRPADGHPARQAEAPQRLSDARQHPWLGWLAQVLMGSVVDSPELLAVVVPQVTKLLGRRVRDDGGLGARHGYDGVVFITGFPPHLLRSSGFPFGERFTWD